LPEQWPLLVDTFRNLAELAETNAITGAPIADDSIQPMYWGNPSRVMVMMGHNTQWDPMAQLLDNPEENER
jgi:hypothetical protein